MPNQDFWAERFNQIGIHSVGPGDTASEAELHAHKQMFSQVIQPWIVQLKGPVLDFGCGIGRWVPDLPRPYVGLDLLPEHLDFCQDKYRNEQQVEFLHSSELANLSAKSFKAIFTCTVLQHIVEMDLRKKILRQFHHLLADDGVLLSVEWAEGQRQYDWCTAVTERQLTRWFNVEKVNSVTESGRISNVWWGYKKKSSWFFRSFSR